MSVVKAVRIEAATILVAPLAVAGRTTYPEPLLQGRDGVSVVEKVGEKDE